jgi:hypothetical protein
MREMKTHARRKPLNPAFKRFQVLPPAPSLGCGVEAQFSAAAKASLEAGERISARRLVLPLPKGA